MVEFMLLAIKDLRQYLQNFIEFLQKILVNHKL